MSKHGSLYVTSWLGMTGEVINWWKKIAHFVPLMRLERMRERKPTLFCVAYSLKTLSSDALFWVQDIKLHSDKSGLRTHGFLHMAHLKTCTHSYAHMGSERFLLVFLSSLQKNPPIFLFRYPFSLLITGLFHCLPQLPPFDAPLEGIWSPSMISTFFFCPSPTPAFFPSPEWCHSASDHRRSEGVSEASDGSLSLQINRPCPLTLSQSISSPYFHFYSAISSFSPISGQMF